MNLIKFIVVGAYLICLMTLTACSNSEKPNGHIPAKEHGNTPAYTSTYVCPMHCPGGGSAKPGICPGCGMDYVKLTEHTKNGHIH